MIRKPWLAYLTLCLVAGVGYLVANSPIQSGPVFNMIGLSAPAAILVGIRRNRPSRSRAWRFFALALTLFVAGDVLTYNYEGLFHHARPFPSVGDVLYLAAYPCAILGFLGLIRGRTQRRDPGILIDSLVITVGVGLVSWVTLVAPYVHDSSLPLPAKLVSIAYPLMDLLLLAAAVRLVVGSGRGGPAFRLLVLAVLSLLVTDAVYGWQVAHGGYQVGTPIDGGWIAFYLFWGAAALHPSMRDLEEPVLGSDTRRPRVRLALLSAAALLCPAVNVYQSLRGELVDPGIVSGFSAGVFLLVIVRLGQLTVDVTSLRRTEEQLRAAEAKYRNLVEKLPAIVYIAEFGLEGRWLYVSPRVQDILGYSPGEWMSDPKVWQDRLHPEDRARVLDEELVVLRSGSRLRTQYRIRARDGRLVWIQEEADAVLDEQGRATLLQGIMYDISEQKLAELMLHRALVKEQEAADELRALDELKNSFLQAVSHDLRTPLTTILGNAATLQRLEGTLSPDDARDLLGRIETNARRLHRILTDLLDVDRLSKGIVEPQRQWVDVPELIDRVLRECSAEAIRVDVQADPVSALVDPAQVDRILENLVMNALRHTPEDASVWIRASAVDEGLFLVVEDSGPGVPAHLREAIFEPFRRGDLPNQHAVGVGVGLSLVALFTELEGGRAWVEERPGGGASFRVLLPVAVRPIVPAPAGRRVIP